MNPSDLGDEERAYLKSLLGTLRDADRRVREMGVNAVDPDWKQLRNGLHDAATGVADIARRLGLL